MLQNLRRRKSFKKKLTAYIVLLALFSLFFLLYSLFSKNETFISPLGKSNIDRFKVEKKLQENNILFSEVLVTSDSSYRISVPNNGQVIFSSQKNIDKQIASLQRILQQLTIEGKSFKNVDFRFEEPIISY